MDINWLGHSCFRIRGREATIVTDPYDRTSGYPALRLTADIVTISHEHPHHSTLAVVQPAAERQRVVNGPGEYEVAGVLIEGVTTYRDKQRGKVHGKNTAYLLHLDDLTVCHLGDLGHTLNQAQIEALKDADIVMVPVGGGCTIDAAEAAEVVSQLEPKLVIPMHYGTPNVPLEGVERFCKEMAVDDLATIPRLSITRSGLPDEPRVVLLAPPEARR
ncbi:MAG: MBL fold metallo-hydrolase [Chloroflexi bacterium]|nr:MBL fold metallo-hydrolase [Chloroflexota bacterium]